MYKAGEYKKALEERNKVKLYRDITIEKKEKKQRLTKQIWMQKKTILERKTNKSNRETDND